MSKQRVILTLVSFLAIFIVFIIWFSRTNYQNQIIIDGHVFKVDIAETSYLRERGLSGRSSLLPDAGMFFVFNSPGRYGFWMKDMNFPIDVVWIDQNLKIIGFQKNLIPETYPNIFYPTQDVQYVLEISAGKSNEIGMRVGDSVKVVRGAL